VYQATAKVKMVKSAWNTNDASFSFGPEKLPEECRVVRSDKILDQAITNLNLNAAWGKQFNQGTPLTTEQSRQRLKTVLDVHPARGAIMIEIQAAGGDYAEVSGIVNEVTKLYCDFRRTDRERSSRRSLD